jgi:hypothetical protein
MSAPLSSRQKGLYPMKVCCVVAEDEDFRDSTFSFIEKHCLNLGIEYNIRVFNSSMYRKDRNNIMSLPAFHIYTFNHYEETFYPKEDIVHILDGYLDMTKEKQLKRKEKREAWNKYFELPKRIFRVISSGSLSSAEATPSPVANPMHD